MVKSWLSLTRVILESLRTRSIVTIHSSHLIIAEGVKCPWGYDRIIRDPALAIEQIERTRTNANMALFDTISNEQKSVRS